VARHTVAFAHTAGLIYLLQDITDVYPSSAHATSLTGTAVTVVGGGAVGLCSAQFLERAGCRVTVVERAAIGRGASWGNAGEISPGFLAPLPAPGLLREALLGLPLRDSALRIPLRADAALLRFLLRFSSNVTHARYRRGVQALARFGADAGALFTELDTSGAIAGKDGYVEVFSTRAAAEKGLRAYRELGPSLSAGILDQDELAALEPALGRAAVAGFLLEDQWWIDPPRFLDALASDLRRRGVEIIEGSRVTSVELQGPSVVVRTSTGDLETGAVVLAAGIETRALCRRLGTDLNLFPGNGYSFSVQADPMPRRPVDLGDAHVVLTPLQARLRVAGTMELTSNHDTFRPGRIASIVKAARPYLKAADWENRTNEWVGTRVLTPDGLPAIGQLPGANRVVIATGHNMLGLMLAPATGRLVTEILSAGSVVKPAGPFDPRRLARAVRPS
jgi:D-amino-acid dehydrogenase